MLEKLQEVKTALETFGLFAPVAIAVNVFIPTMAMVYLFGVMLNFAKSDRAKNAIGAVTALSTSALYIMFQSNSMFIRCWNIYIVWCMVIIFYVLFGFSLRSRIDSLLDKFAKDKAERKSRKRNGK